MIVDTRSEIGLDVYIPTVRSYSVELFDFSIPENISRKYHFTILQPRCVREIIDLASGLGPRLCGWRMQ
jgi:hypothetical protein